MHEHSIDEELVPKMPVTKKTSHISPVRDTPVQSNFEKSGNPGGNVETSTMDATINHGEQSTKSTHKQTTTIPPKVSTTESFHEEVLTSNITAHISDTDANVNIGEGVLHT